MRKYRNVPTVVDGMRFDSKAEARRWAELQLLQKAGEIHGLERQVSYVLEVNGEIITRYRADFTYRLQDGSITVEDVKSPATARLTAFVIKSRLMHAVKSITVRVVYG